jgi:hypothetical protein
VHLANKHDFANPALNNKAERGAVQAIGDELAGSERPFVLAAAMFRLAPGRVATEQDRSPFHGIDSMRGGSENLALEFAERGVHTIVTRFAPTVHGDGDNGFMAALVATARAKGVSAYIGDGANRWAAVHRLDAGRIVRLALDKRPAAGTVLHAAAETGVPTREIAEAIGRGLGIPAASVPAERAGEHFGWLSRFYETDMAAASEATRAVLGWAPAGPTLAGDLESGCYYR